MKTTGDILEKNNITVDIVYNKALTDRIYKAVGEYAQERTKELYEKEFVEFL